MKIFKNITIYKKLIIVFVFIIVIPMYFSFFVSFRTTKNLMINEFTKETENSVFLIKNNVENVLRKVSSAISYLDQEQSIKEFLIKPDREKLDDELEPEDKIKNIRMLENVEKILTNIKINFLGAESYITLYNNNKEYYTNYYVNNHEKLIRQIGLWSDAFESEKNPAQYILWKGLEENYAESYKEAKNPYVISFGKEITDKHQRTSYGSVVISIMENEVSSLMSMNDEVGYRMVIDDEGVIISSTIKEWIGEKIYFLDQIGKNDIIKNESGTLIRNFDDFGRSIIAYDTIHRNNWKVISVRSWAKVDQNIVQIRNNLLFMNLICIIIFILLSLSIAKSITRPIHSLSQRMKDIDLDDYTTVNTPKSFNEVRILEKSFNTMKENLNILIEENKNKEEKKREAQIKALQAQINPHFLFNTLNAIRWAAINKKTQKVSEMILSLVKLLKRSIEKGKELTTIEEEIDMIKNYINILAMRNSKEIEIEYKFKEDILKCKIPTLLIQPIVENAVFHGLGQKKNNAKLIIEGIKEKDDLIINIIDNGQGIDDIDINAVKKTSKSDFGGIGLENVDERIKLYYGEKYGLTINSIPRLGTKTTLKIHCKL